MNPIRIPCASGNNPHTDLVIQRNGDRIQILGHPEMNLTSDAAQAAVHVLLHHLDAIQQPGHAAVMAVREKLLNRQGRIYRHSDGMDFIDALQYAQNQAIDTAVALQQALTAEQMRMDDGK